MQPLQICIGPAIRIGRESWCLPYAGFFSMRIDQQERLFPSSQGSKNLYFLGTKDIISLGGTNHIHTLSLSSLWTLNFQPYFQ